MVLRDVDRLEGMLNSETDRPNKKKHITEYSKLQVERWGVSTPSRNVVFLPK
jgi:hypothetical protein